MLAGPLLLVIGPLLAAVAASLLERWRRATAVFAAAALGLFWLLLWLAEADQQLFLIGRPYTLTTGVQSLWLLIYFGVELLFLLGIFFPQGRKFVPGLLIALALLAAAMMIRPFLLGSMILVSGLAVTAVVVQDDRAGEIQGALRYLAQAVVTLPFLLVAGWMLESRSTGLEDAFTLTLVLGGLVLLAAFPFHVWATTVLNEASPLAWVFVFGLMPLVVVNFLYSFWTAGGTANLNAQVAELIFIAAGLTLLLALLLLTTAVTVRRFVMGLLLIDLAAVVVTLGLGPVDGWQAAVALQIGRLPALLFISTGFLLCQRHGFGPFWLPSPEDKQIDSPKSQGRLWPFCFALFGVGCLSLLGFPLTVGFGGRWALVNELLLQGEETAVAYWLALLLLLVMGVGGMVCLRGIQFWFSQPNQVEAELHSAREPRWLQVIILMGLLVSLFLALQPQIILTYAGQLVQALSG